MNTQERLVVCFSRYLLLAESAKKRARKSFFHYPAVEVSKPNLFIREWGANENPIVCHSSIVRSKSTNKDGTAQNLSDNRSIEAHPSPDSERGCCCLLLSRLLRRSYYITLHQYYESVYTSVVVVGRECSRGCRKCRSGTHGADSSRDTIGDCSSFGVVARVGSSHQTTKCRRTCDWNLARTT